MYGWGSIFVGQKAGIFPSFNSYFYLTNDKRNDINNLSYKTVKKPLQMSDHELIVPMSVML